MPSEARPAATVLLLRDASDAMEVFMIERHRNIQFMGGALVFPGGRVNPEDAELTQDRQAEIFSDFTFRVAAIREAFEECGVLMARDVSTGALVDDKRRESLEDYRKKLEDGSVTMSEFIQNQKLDLCVEMLVPFAHWITPEVESKRFDTMFYLAAAPLDHTAEHDGSESVDSLWIKPQQAIADGAEGRRAVMFPTRLNLEKLAESSCVEAALDAARASKIVTVLPEMHGDVLHIPVEAGYSVSEESIARAIPGAKEG